MVGIEFFTENDLKFLIGIGISIFAGFLVGIERETKNKPTGIGTITLVVAGEQKAKEYFHRMETHKGKEREDKMIQLMNIYDKQVISPLQNLIIN